MGNASRESGTPVPGEAPKELLLEELRYFSESFWRNEQVGETCVNYFVSLVTAVVAALVALMSSQHSPAGQPLKYNVVSAFDGPFLYRLGYSGTYPKAQQGRSIQARSGHDSRGVPGFLRSG